MKPRLPHSVAFLSVLAATVFIGVSYFDVDVSRIYTTVLRDQGIKQGIHTTTTRTFRMEAVNNSAALPTLQRYNSLFNPNGKLTVDPNDMKTVRNYWQAGAMIDWYIHDNQEPRYKCKNLWKVKNRLICMDESFNVKKPCLVYSFGIANDFSFDDAFGRLGCEVHSFDPSMLNAKEGKRNANVTFHKIGLGYQDTAGFKPRKDGYVRTPQTWKVLTLAGISKLLGHEGRVIDVVKLDIEGYEWNATQNILDSRMSDNVKQYIVEWHLMPGWPLISDYVEGYRTLTRWRDAGFEETFHACELYNIKPKKRLIHIQCDVGYVNAVFKNKQQKR